MARGINLSAWFSNALHRQPLTNADFRQIKSAGFDHVRIPVKPEWYGFDWRPDGGPATISFPEVEAAIATAIAHDLSVNLCLQLQVDHKPVLETDDRAEDRYVQLCVAVGRRLAQYPIDRIAYEPINEFNYWNDFGRYNRLQMRLHAAVRAVLPGCTIILTGPRGSRIDAMDGIVPVDDPDTIYAFHFYEPFIITHQGVPWGFPGRAIRWFRGVPYPSSLVQTGFDYAPDAPDKAKASAELAEYVNGKWDQSAVASRIERASQWAARHRVKVVCTEFGVLQLHIDPVSRYRWIRDARTALEANRIGWTLWDYTDLFGITDLFGAVRTDAESGDRMLVSPDQGRRYLQPAAVRALFSRD